MPSVSMAATTKKPRVFLDVSIGAEPAGRLTIELFIDKTPRTCENFRQLCTGEHNRLSFAKVPFHRVIDEFMVQGGDIEKGDGTGITSIYDGEAFEDEHLDWRAMDVAGLVCSANRGRDTNGSQFFITLEPCPHLSGKHTIFGRLVSGDDTLQRIAKVAVDKNDRPIEPVLVSRCGELEKKMKQKERESLAENPAVQAHGGERGRRRKSDPSDDEMDANTPPLRTGRRSRRQSDNVVDEGIRGRPRARSNSRSNSNPIEEEDEISDVSVHKRKRSPSPSRHMDRRDEGAEPERRRRSLPNQYRNGGNRDYGDTDRYRPSPRRNDQRHASRRDVERSRPIRDHQQGSGRLNSNDGRLGGRGGYDDDGNAPVKFKGRGAMKYRENDRAW